MLRLALPGLVSREQNNSESKTSGEQLPPLRLQLRGELEKSTPLGSSWLSLPGCPLGSVWQCFSEQILGYQSRTHL